MIKGGTGRQTERLRLRDVCGEQGQRDSERQKQIFKRRNNTRAQNRPRHRCAHTEVARASTYTRARTHAVAACFDSRGGGGGGGRGGGGGVCWCVFWEDEVAGGGVGAQVVAHAFICWSLLGTEEVGHMIEGPSPFFALLSCDTQAGVRVLSSRTRWAT